MHEFLLLFQPYSNIMEKGLEEGRHLSLLAEEIISKSL